LRLIDTNVIVYALGKSHPLKENSRRILADVATGSLEATVDVETLQEILHLYSSRRERKKGFETVDNLLVLIPRPVAIQREDIEEAGKLMAQYSFLGARDAIHAAVLITHGLEGIITADRVFGRIRNLTRFPIN
jgi:uncharacterized protein